MSRKRRRKKKTSAPNFKFSIEITGLILVVLSVIGLLSLGIIGDLVKKFTIFFFGAYYNILIILFLVLGIYMMFKRKMPTFFTQRLIGLYILIISFLTICHINLIEPGVGLGASCSNLLETYLGVTGNNFINLSQTGGGFIGLITCWCLFSLAERIGTIIIVSVFILFGIILMLEIPFSAITDKISKFFEDQKIAREEARKRHILEEQEADEELDVKPNIKKILNGEKIEEIEPEEEEKDKAVISSVEELKKLHGNTVEDVPEIPVGPIPTMPNVSINNNYRLPRLDEVLEPIKKNQKKNDEEFIRTTITNLQNVLADFQITAHVVDYHEGPTVTQFELAIKNGTKISRITGLSKEIALSLAAKDVRIEAPIPGKTTVGVEIPNKVAVGVPIREVLEKKLGEMKTLKLPVALGKDIHGSYCITDLAKTPHLLVAGSTGSGKSVCINSFINSLLITKRPDEVKIVLVDPKKVELSNYNGVPHLLCPVVTDPKKASIALQNIVRIMEDRYNKFADEKVKNISGYNDKMETLMKQNPEDNTITKMPYILVIIDELADLMLVASKEVEDSIMRITQMARAAGIHLIVATQRPSTDVITGVVKANIPSRISFAVASQIDSRTILDSTGAEKLIGKGDMLFKPMGENYGKRIQGNFISDEEIEQVIRYVCKQQVAQYDESITMAAPSSGEGSGGSDLHEDSSEEDALWGEVVDFAIEQGKISASLIQRRFKVGYNRAARLVDDLEARGIVGPQNGSKPREVLVKLDPSLNDQSE